MDSEHLRSITKLNFYKACSLFVNFTPKETVISLILGEIGQKGIATRAAGKNVAKTQRTLLEQKQASNLG